MNGDLSVCSAGERRFGAGHGLIVRDATGIRAGSDEGCSDRQDVDDGVAARVVRGSIVRD